MNNWLGWVSWLPLVVFFYLLLFRKWRLLTATLVMTLVVMILVSTGWGMGVLAMTRALGKGFFVALDILIIIWGALYFLNVMEKTRVLDSVSYHLETVSLDYRVQVILLAWFLENFIEGTAGFGTPTVVVVPLLIALGITPIKAVILSLLGNSTAVVFGAAGTPIRVGFAGLDVTGVSSWAANFNLVGFIVPIFMLWFLVMDKKNKWRQFGEGLPMAIVSGLSFVMVSWVIERLIGQEFPSILGSALSLGMVLGLLKLGWLTPSVVRKNEGVEMRKVELSLGKTAAPYVILVGLLLLGKFGLGTAGLVIPWIGSKFSLFNPGWMFLIAGWIWAWCSKPKIKTGMIVKESFVKTLEPFSVIFLMSFSVQMMIASAVNPFGIPGVIEMMAGEIASAWLPIGAALAGALGSFLTGSATVSDIMFGGFFSSTSLKLGLDSAKILALVVVGGAAGNMVALADMLTAETVAGIKNREREIVGWVIIPCLICVIFAGLVGSIFIVR